MMKGLQRLYSGVNLKKTVFLLTVSIILSNLVLSVSYANLTSSITTTICQIFNTIHSVIFVLGLALMVVGAALYAAGNVMPSDQKSQVQGYGMSMIFGGVIGVIIALAAPAILSIISGQASIAASCSGAGLL